MPRSAILLAFVLLGAAHLTLASEDPTESLPGVQDLTPDNFDKIVNGAKAVLIEFYAPWCGHCKRMTPEYKKLGELVNSNPKLKGRVVIAKVNADAHRSLGDKFEVRGFPTIKYLPRGKAPTKENAVDYNQARTAEKFLEYLQEQVASDKGFARVDALADIAKKFKDAADKSALIKEAKAKIAKVAAEEKENAELYVKLMEKAVEKGVDYLAKEKSRLEKMLGSGGVHSSKVDEMSRKASILGALSGDEE
mmetsp:Transcript_27918/g.61277  ORF Transcript_27918/g.61277 Transcript_27918/m.61277 type:complete len:250 (-) Transcript_27918:220-969(-)|eukprot:CAMPEP_0202899892 /NCGR_PEP_ID=MMETSP1392-20130828/9185_1 /ASSEMBLY_ACC=CAM_ASM_000868 /TAXON_ID=225041 /ORGANISM="Chlamydomonas chlamydogama, Strain SAG 11-48b" /LENGTH=249 /DNA_ID=CAMNT_0049586187 /DNA_START=20 /DNA_END=769 /DNA_ORIENTATION=+